MQIFCNLNYSYVPKPEKVLEELFSDGEGMPEVEQGKIVAGDAAELDLLTLKKRSGGKLLVLYFYYLDSKPKCQNVCKGYK